MIDVLLAHQTYGKSEIQEVVHSLESGFVTMGHKVALFEKMFADYIGVDHAVMVNSGSSANLLALAVLVQDGRIRPGEEVLVPALTWPTGVWPVIQLGLKPVFVEIDPKTLCMSVPAVKNELLRARYPLNVFPAHILGNMFPGDAIRELKEQGALVVEDCCEALGSSWNNVRAGGMGELGTFSFYFSHHITTIEGGMVVTDDALLADLLRSMRSHGWIRGMEREEEIAALNGAHDPRFLFINGGYNFRPTELQAAFGIHQLPRVEEWNTKRRIVAQILSERLRDVEELELTEPPSKVRHSWFAFPVLVKRGHRGGFAAHLEKHGIQTRPILAGNLLGQPAFRGIEYRVSGGEQNVERVGGQGLYWGCHPGMNENHVNHIVDTVKGYFAKQKAA